MGFIFSGLSKSVIIVMLLFIFNGCTPKKLPTAKSIILYNTMIYDFKGTDYPSLDTISTVVRKLILDKTILQSFNSAVRYTESNTIWKGYIIGKVVFENERFAWIRISRYGAFFKDVQTNSYYKIVDKGNKEAWENFIDNFSTENIIKKG